MRSMRVSSGAHTRTRMTCGMSFSRCTAPQPRMTPVEPSRRNRNVSSAVKIDRLVLSVVSRSQMPDFPSRRRSTWLLRSRILLAMGSMISW